ncbi:MAG: phosphoglycerate kinase [Eubacteriales bacterium]
MKKTIKDIDVKGKRVIVRCDFNVPLDTAGEISDYIRITSAIPTIKYLIEHKAKVILISHLGRPDGLPNMEFTLKPVAEELAKLLDMNIDFVSSPRVVDDNVRSAVAKMEEGQVILLENVRFRKEETEDDPEFSKELASLGDIFVEDAFGAAHRAHASIYGIAKYLPGVSGFLLEREVKFLGNAVDNPLRPFLAIMGGAKIGDKILVIERLLDLVDSLIIGGGMAYTFIKATGHEIGKSLVEEDKLDLALRLIQKAKDKNVKLLLPIDVIAAREFSNVVDFTSVDADKIPKDMMGLDIGKGSIKLFVEEIEKSETILWNGPMGVFEMSNFAEGTFKIAQAMSVSKGITIIGGGDSAAAVLQFGLSDKMTHISTGGGASLEFIGGKELPGISILEDK